jgi:hypothetical protein
VLQIHEVYEYQVTRYDKSTGEGGLYAGINTFLKIKAEASGYPNWVRSPADEDRYIEEFKHSEGIILDKTQIKYNAAKHGLSKLCLNSLWGKFCERSGRSQTDNYRTSGII